MKSNHFLNLAITLLATATTSLATFAAQNEQSEKVLDKVFDGGSMVCLEQADIGNPGVVIKKTGQETQEDGILMSFEVTSKICTEKNGKFVIQDSRPLTQLNNGSQVQDHEVVFTTDSSQEGIQILGSSELDLEKTKTRIEILVPKSMKNKKMDSFLRVKIIDSEGPSLATFGEFRHQIK